MASHSQGGNEISKKSDVDLPKVAPTSTKKEILDAYHQLVEQIESRSGQELRPEKEKEVRRQQKSARLSLI